MLKKFFSHIGEIELLEIRGRVSFILFKNFFEANTAREFLQNGQNFKESEKNNFGVRWMVPDDLSNLSEDFRKRLSRFNHKFLEHKAFSGSLNGINNQNGINNMSQINMMIGHNNMLGNLNKNANIMNQPFLNNGNNMGPNSYYQNQMMNQNSFIGNMANINNSLSNLNNNLQNPNNNLQNLSNNLQNLNNNLQNTNNSNQIQLNSNPNMSKLQNNKTPQNHRKGSQSNEEKDDKKLAGVQGQNGKYTCRFEILIENDKDFQVARRLIGAKVDLQFNIIRDVT